MAKILDEVLGANAKYAENFGEKANLPLPPSEALKAASAQRNEMVPLFVEEIETYLALDPAARPKQTPLFFIFHLLGEWREKAAYRPLARLLKFLAGT